jgi:hypothetical protein
MIDSIGYFESAIPAYYHTIYLEDIDFGFVCIHFLYNVQHDSVVLLASYHITASSCCF